MTQLSATAIVAAEQTYDTVKPGAIAGVVFVLLFVALYFLWRSMNKQLKKVDKNYADGGSAAGPVDEAGTAESDAAQDSDQDRPRTD